MTRTRISWVALLPLLAFCLAACSDDNEPDKAANEKADRETLATLEANIDAFIGTPECDGINDCRSLPFGAKPCGGPWSFKIFALSAADSATLDTMIHEYNVFNAELNGEYGWASDCMIVEEPFLDCLGGRCIPIEPAR